MAVVERDIENACSGVQSHTCCALVLFACNQKTFPDASWLFSTLFEKSLWYKGLTDGATPRIIRPCFRSLQRLSSRTITCNSHFSSIPQQAILIHSTPIVSCTQQTASLQSSISANNKPPRQISLSVLNLGIVCAHVALVLCEFRFYCSRPVFMGALHLLTVALLLLPAVILSLWRAIAPASRTPATHKLARRSARVCPARSLLNEFRWGACGEEAGGGWMFFA